MNKGEGSARPAETRLAALLVLSLGGAAALALGYHLWGGREDVEPDMSALRGRRPEVVPVEEAPAAFAARGAAPAPEGSVGLLKAGPLAARPERRPASAKDRLASAVRGSESRYDALARAYSRKYPVIREYGRDWMNYPDLKRFNDEYFRDRNPVKFAVSVAASPNFAALVKKYAHRPEMVAFIQDAAQLAPAELMAAAQDYLKQDRNSAGLLMRFSTAMGLPQHLAAGLAGGRMDAQKAAAAVLDSAQETRRLLREGAPEAGR